MKSIFLLFFICCLSACQAQNNDETVIRTILKVQAEAWNRGDLAAFMQPYWQNDSLMFVGKGGVTWGWNNTLARYRQGYPDKEAMGKLFFDIVRIQKLSSDYFFITGKWMLQRKMGDLSGHFTLLIRKINGQWKIVADHSS